jgi:hypothetical protein
MLLTLFFAEAAMFKDMPRLCNASGLAVEFLAPSAATAEQTPNRQLPDNIPLQQIPVILRTFFRGHPRVACSTSQA